MASHMNKTDSEKKAVSMPSSTAVPAGASPEDCGNGLGLCEAPKSCQGLEVCNRDLTRDRVPSTAQMPGDDAEVEEPWPAEEIEGYVALGRREQAPEPHRDLAELRRQQDPTPSRLIQENHGMQTAAWSRLMRNPSSSISSSSLGTAHYEEEDDDDEREQEQGQEHSQQDQFSHDQQVNQQAVLTTSELGELEEAQSIGASSLSRQTSAVSLDQSSAAMDAVSLHPKVQLVECEPWGQVVLKVIDTGADTSRTLMLAHNELQYFRAQREDDERIARQQCRHQDLRVQRPRHHRRNDSTSSSAASSLGSFVESETNAIGNIFLAKGRQHVIDMLFWENHGPEVHLAFRFCARGDLFALLAQIELCAHDIRLYAAEIASAIGYVHSLGFRHGDVKAENIGIDEEGHCVLLDFDLAHKLEPGQRSISNSGSLLYAAPEVLCRFPHRLESDWWSVGVLIFEMAYGYMPFDHPDPQVLCDQICTEPYMHGDFPVHGSQDANILLESVIDQFLEKNPQDRLGSGADFAEVIRHPYFRGQRTHSHETQDDAEWTWSSFVQGSYTPHWLTSASPLN